MEDIAYPYCQLTVNVAVMVVITVHCITYFGKNVRCMTNGSTIIPPSLAKMRCDPKLREVSKIESDLRTFLDVSKKRNRIFSNLLKHSIYVSRKIS